MNRTVIIIFLIMFYLSCAEKLYSQSKSSYDFINEEWLVPIDSLITGKTNNLNDTCYYVLKFVDNTQKMIEKKTYCKENEVDVCYYKIPNRKVKLTYQTLVPEPPYEFITKTEMVYRIKGKCKKCK